MDPKVSFRDLVRMMVDADVELVQSENGRRRDSGSFAIKAPD